MIKNVYWSSLNTGSFFYLVIVICYFLPLLCRGCGLSFDCTLIVDESSLEHTRYRKIKHSFYFNYVRLCIFRVIQDKEF
jgi:hypothetical protein